MDAFVTSYGLDYVRFRELISANDVLMAGSSALSLYLQQLTGDSVFEPNDIDIWFSHVEDVGHFYQIDSGVLFYDYLLECGYHEMKKKRARYYLVT